MQRQNATQIYKERLRKRQEEREKANPELRKPLPPPRPKRQVHVGGAAGGAISTGAMDVPLDLSLPEIKPPAGVRLVSKPEYGFISILASLIVRCVCGHTRFTASEQNGLQIHCCDNCGVKHQNLRMTPQDLEKWYIDQYQRYRAETGRHMRNDSAVANSRLNTYGAHFHGRTLDLGTANGAFVTAARARGFDAWGQDLSDDALSDFVYAGRLEDLHFPTDHFQTVTIHDMLEHVLDPWTLLNETHRLLDQNGTLIIDFPDFEAPEGRHHWKVVEHIWLFSLDQLKRLCESLDFETIKVDRPIPGRYMLYLRKRYEKRVSILVAPGIGDSYWALGKLPAICQKHNLGIPDIWVSDLGDKQRSLPCVQKIPLVHGAGYRKGSHASKVWHEAYMLKGRAIYQNHCECDYFVAANGNLRAGLSMDEILPEYEMNWYLPMFRSKEEDRMTAWARQQWGDYIVAYFLDVGMYKFWVQAFGVARIVDALKRIQQELNCRVVLSGAVWDQKAMPTRIVQAASDPNFVDFTGRTTFDELLGLYRGSIGAIGYPSGSTIMANVLKTPLMLFWNNYFTDKFWRNCCTPESLGYWYEIADTHKITPEIVSHRFVDLVKRNRK